MTWVKRKPALKAARAILATGFGEHAEVCTKLPTRNRPDRFVVVQRIGGGQVNPATDVARILVECYSRRMDAEDMTCTASEALHNAAGTWHGTPPMFIRGYGNEMGISGNNPNPDAMDHERWQFIGELSVAVNR